MLMCSMSGKFIPHDVTVYKSLQLILIVGALWWKSIKLSTTMDNVNVLNVKKVCAAGHSYSLIIAINIYHEALQWKNAELNIIL